MCALCGGLEREPHWTDRLPRDDPDGDGAASWRQSREAQVALVNRILGQDGLEVRDWNGHVFVLSNRTGRSEIVPQLAAVWSAVERDRKSTRLNSSHRTISYAVFCLKKKKKKKY